MKEQNARLKDKYNKLFQKTEEDGSHFVNYMTGECDKRSFEEIDLINQRMLEIEGYTRRIN